jgi:uncharacterized protein YpuA (DUF1002 family)
MKKENSLGYFSLATTISELNKIGETNLANKLQDIVSKNELPKPDKHNKKDDRTTSYYYINLNEEDLEKIVDLFLDLEVGNLTLEGETTKAASHYSDMVNQWSSIKPIK